MSFVLTKSDLDRLFVNMFSKAAPRAYMMGVRGALPERSGGSTLDLNSNEVGLNNDALGVIWENRVQFYQGTLDPGASSSLTPARRRDYRVKGEFHIGDGLQTTIKGDHCPERSTCYEAFRIQNATGWRDRGNLDGVFDSGDYADVTVPEHINIHRGSRSNVVGAASEGCCNVISSQWLDFKELGYEVLNQKFLFWVIGGLRLRDSLHSKTPILLSVNGTSIGPNVSAWLSSQEPGKTKVAVRPFLTHLQRNGAAIDFEFRPAPNRLIFPNIAGGDLPLEIADGEGVASLRDVVTKLDEAAQFDSQIDSRRIDIRSERLAAFLPQPRQVRFVESQENGENVVDFV